MPAPEDASEALEVGGFAEGEYIGRFQVSDLEIGGDDLGPWIEATVRMENSSGEPLSPAQLDVHCEGESGFVGYQADSTFDLNMEIPAESFREGVVNLVTIGSPGQVSHRQHATPAFVQVTPVISEGDDPQPRFAIPDSLVDEYNAQLLD